jgi:hypothetical protein
VSPLYLNQLLYLMWNMLHQISGKFKCTSVPGISVCSIIVTLQPDVVNVLTSACISDQYDVAFTQIKENAERMYLSFIFAE